ncbi:uncharacterized protein PHALS_04185 [Plasmopara halstedii]|uniref:Uncharacterized protein n=1 Tax=Plasmopara halstedii TaxID=4781 RepID=A0A0P1A9A9_PLAHL|nr:uncharacterized protein PHALS_04185 [Plasmopara halstedii]CEG36935.1 hypothetical protein PHALS_04185 [Plasmopara halstedii]|eukprot:XP_024573304.1 hypothetical protein PHALS_04185 [Plasmopara halstedii]
MHSNSVAFFESGVGTFAATEEQPKHSAIVNASSSTSGRSVKSHPLCRVCSQPYSWVEFTNPNSCKVHNNSVALFESGVGTFAATAEQPQQMLI